MIAVLKIFSLITGLLKLAGLLIRIALVAFFAAIMMRVGGLVTPEMLPGFWTVVGLGVLVIVGPAMLYGEDQYRRAERDKTIEGAEKKYRS